MESTNSANNVIDIDEEYLLINKKYLLPRAWRKIRRDNVDRIRKHFNFKIKKCDYEKFIINENAIMKLSTLEDIIECINSLTMGGRLINTVDRSYHSLLYYLVKCNKPVESIVYLLKKCASFDNDKSMTPIIFVCKTVEMARFCIDNGCNVHALNVYGDYVVDRIFDDDEIDLLRFFVSKGIPLIADSRRCSVYESNLMSLEIVDAIFSLCSDEEKKHFMRNEKVLCVVFNYGTFDERTKRVDMYIKHGYDFNCVYDNLSLGNGITHSALNILIDHFTYTRDLKMLRYILVQTSVKCEMENFEYFGIQVCRINNIGKKHKKRVLSRNINWKHVYEVLDSDDEKYLTHRHIAQLILSKVMCVPCMSLVSKSAMKSIM